MKNNNLFLKNLFITDLQLVDYSKKSHINLFKFSISESDNLYYLAQNSITQTISLYEDEFLLTADKGTCTLILQKLINETKKQANLAS